MKLHKLTTAALLSVAVLLSACHTGKHAVDETALPTPKTIEKKEILQKVNSQQMRSLYLTSKMKFSIQTGQQKVAVTGSFKMKRDEVIRLQLMAFGFVEAGRLEFTPDYVLLVDRINKQYMKTPYNYLDFMRNNGLNFYSIQALFLNELFLPGEKHVTDKSSNKFETTRVGDDVIINYADGADDRYRNALTYNWLVDLASGLIQMASINYRSVGGQNDARLNWDYKEFKPFNKTKYPTNMAVTLTTPKKEVKMDLVLTSLGNDDGWELYTTVSNKYKEVSIEDLLKRFMSL